jgi:hypothetical protein
MQTLERKLARLQAISMSLRAQIRELTKLRAELAETRRTAGVRQVGSTTTSAVFAFRGNGETPAREITTTAP